MLFSQAYCFRDSVMPLCRKFAAEGRNLRSLGLPCFALAKSHSILFSKLDLAGSGISRLRRFDFFADVHTKAFAGLRGPGRSCTVSNDPADSELNKKAPRQGSFVVGPLAQGLRSRAGRTAEPQEGNLLKRQPILTTFDYPT